MTKKLIFTIISCITGIYSNSQTHQLFLKPGSSGKDAYIHDLNVNQNLGTHNDYAAIAWTCNGPQCNARGLLDFDWSLLPAGAIITQASLKLYLNPTSTNGTSSGDNIAWVERITSPWEEMNVTWANQPTVTQVHRTTVGPSASNSAYSTDVTQLVIDILDNPMAGFGFRISLQTEDYYRRLMFASSDNADCSIHPELLVEYTLPTGPNPPVTTVTHLNLQPDPSAGKDAYIHDLHIDENRGNSNEFASVTWTCSGPQCIAHSLIDFDLSSIPSNSEIIDATLYLYQNSSSSNGPHSGDNASYLRSITQQWDEQTVTWANAPATTTFDQVLLNSSVSSTQNYEVNVSQLIQNQIDNPEAAFGMMISLVNESPYKRLTFASSDNLNCSLRPRLEISYRPSSLGIPTHPKDSDFIHVYPNPTSGGFYLETKENASYVLTDPKGEIVLNGNTIKSTENRLDINTLSAGIYFLQVVSDGNSFVQKIVKN